jgi:hypothetical protein
MRINLNNIKVSIAIWLLDSCHYKSTTNNVLLTKRVADVRKMIDCV